VLREVEQQPQSLLFGAAHRHRVRASPLRAAATGRDALRFLPSMTGSGAADGLCSPSAREANSTGLAAQRAATRKLAKLRTLAEVSAPAWLDNPPSSTVCLRRCKPGAGVRAKPMGRAPASLLSQALRERLPPACSRHRGVNRPWICYVLRVELDEFTVFDTPQRAMPLRARATLDRFTPQQLSRRLSSAQAGALAKRLAQAHGLRDAVEPFHHRVAALDGPAATRTSRS